MVPCRRHSDCMACGRHPLTSQHYKCQSRYVLYDTVLTTDEGDATFVNTTGGSSDAFDPDQDEAFLTGKHGICTDIDSSYNEGCSNRIGAAVVDGLIGCMDGFASKFKPSTTCNTTASQPPTPAGTTTRFVFWYNFAKDERTSDPESEYQTNERSRVGDGGGFC